MKSPDETHGAEVAPPTAKPGLAEILKRVPDDVLMAEVDRRFKPDRVIDMIHRAACEVCGTCPQETRRHRYRSKILTPARQLACHVMVEFYGLTESAVARYYDHDRNSVVHAIKRMVQRMNAGEWQARYRETLNRLGKS